MSSEEESEYKPPLTDAQFRRLQPRLKALARRLTGKASDWDDMVQEAGLRLVMHTNWINPIVPAHSAMMNYIRRTNVLPMTPMSFVDGDGGVRAYDDEPAGLDAMIASEMYDFRHLPLTEKEREWAKLHFIDGMTFPEIDAKLGVPQTKFFNAMKRVREEFRKKWLIETGDE